MFYSVIYFIGFYSDFFKAKYLNFYRFLAVFLIIVAQWK